MKQNELAKIEAFWVKMWDLYEQSAKGLKGEEVVRALLRASRQVWEAGIDEAYADAKGTLGEADGIGFDLIWLSVAIIELNRVHLKKKHGRTQTKNR